MKYEPPSSEKPVEVEIDGKMQSFTTQIALGNALKTKYNLRSVQDITSCSTCHR
jgi:hypothetical protein